MICKLCFNKVNNLSSKININTVIPYYSIFLDYLQDVFVHQFVLQADPLWRKFGTGSPNDGITEGIDQSSVKSVTGMLDCGRATQNDAILWALKGKVLSKLSSFQTIIYSDQGQAGFPASLCKSGSGPNIPRSCAACNPGSVPVHS